MPLNMFDQPLGFDRIDFLYESLGLNLQANELGFLRAACNNLFKVNAVKRAEYLEYGLRSYLIKVKNTEVACGYAISTVTIAKVMNILILTQALHETLNQKLGVYTDEGIDYNKDLKNTVTRMNLINLLANAVNFLSVEKLNEYKKESPSMSFELNLQADTILNYRQVRAIKAAMVNQNLKIRVQERHKILNLIKYYYF